MHAAQPHILEKYPIPITLKILELLLARSTRLMQTQAAASPNVVIFGGSAAGLWLLDELIRAGHNPLLLEAHELGAGQTVASQGIIHGGLKYTLKGLFTRSAQAIKQMPSLWRQCLDSQRQPALAATKLRSPFVYLWHTESIGSRFGMFGAKSLLTIKPIALTPDQRPTPLTNCKGAVYRLDEPVIDPTTLIADLAARHHDRIIKIDCEHGLTFHTDSPGVVRAIKLKNPDTNQVLELQPITVIFTAGQGNAQLRQMVGLSPQAMQRRPLHMTVARGNLPPFQGHCVDGSKTRVTITSTTDPHGQTLWQIGGQVAEDGVHMTPQELIAHVKLELAATMGSLDLDHVQWATYRVDRAEAATDSGVRPDDIQTMTQGNVITAWPTKLALVPVLAQHIAQQLKPAKQNAPITPTIPDHWPRPAVARPPWETDPQWS